MHAVNRAGAAVRLSTGASMPTPALGTWRSDPATLASALSHAVSIGYRHFDCAPIYQNEALIGETLEASCRALGVPRADLFLTSKLPPTAMHADAAVAALHATLRALRTEYLDLYVLHWPFAFVEKPSLFPVPVAERLGYDPVNILKVWRVLEREVDAGRIRALGVSNFTRRKLDALMRASPRHAPVANQVEMHPALAQPRLLAFCRARGIVVTSYCPLGSPARPATFTHAGDPDLLRAQPIVTAASKHGRTPAQVLLKWATQRGVVPLPKSVTPSRLEENLRAVHDDAWSLDAEDFSAIATLDCGHRFSRGEHFALEGETVASLWDDDDDGEDGDSDDDGLPDPGPAVGCSVRTDTLHCGTVVLTLEASDYRVIVAPSRGAEVASIRFRGMELLHRALDFSAAASGGWYGHAQLLFPAVGRQRDAQYTWEGVTRKMPLHGLVMEGAPFVVVACAATKASASVTLELTSAALAAGAPDAAAAYPFDFALRVTFSLSSRGLSVSHAMRATGAAATPFSIGNHLSLRAPLDGAARCTWEDLRLRGTPTHEALLAPGSLLSGEERSAPLFAAPSGAPLSTPGVLDGVFGGGAARSPAPATLELHSGALVVRVSQTLTPPTPSPHKGESACDWRSVDARRYFVLWGQAPADGKGGFLCVEPWLGGPDSLNTRDGLAVLLPGEQVAWVWNLSVVVSQAEQSY